MRTIHYELHTSIEPEAIMAIIKSQLIDDNKKLRGILAGKYFYGAIDTQTMSLHTIDKPPMQIKGVITQKAEESKLSLEVSADTIKPQLKAITYALLYPIIFACTLLAIILNPKKISTYLFSIASFFLPILLHEGYMFLNHHEPDPDLAVQKIMQLINGRLVSRQEVQKAEN